MTKKTAKTRPKRATPPAPAKTEAPPPPPPPKEMKRAIASRWTKKLVEGGFTPVSNFFLEYASELEPVLTHGEQLFIIELMFFKWDEEMPRPSFKTIAKRMGIGHAQARKLARQLERKKYLKRHMQESKPNRFDLRPLFAALEKLREEKLAARAAAARRKPRPI